MTQLTTKMLYLTQKSVTMYSQHPTQHEERPMKYPAKVYRDPAPFTHAVSNDNLYWTICGLAADKVSLNNFRPTRIICRDCDYKKKAPEIPLRSPIIYEMPSSNRWHLESLTETLKSFCGEKIPLESRQRFPEEIDKKSRICITCFNRVALSERYLWFPTLMKDK